MEHYNNDNNGGSFSSRRQQNWGNNKARQNTANNLPRSSNLIVINTVPMEEDRKDALRLQNKKKSRDEAVKPVLIRPQDRWALTDEDSMSSTPTRTKS